MRSPVLRTVVWIVVSCVLLAGRGNSEQARQREMVRTTRGHLLALINDALELSRIQAGELAGDAAAENLRLSVSDTGIGIKPEHLAALLQPFRQIDTGLRRRHEGTGLGLAIRQRLAGLLGGRIYVESPQV